MSDQLPGSEINQDPLCVLAVVATLHQSQQQLGGVVLETDRKKTWIRLKAVVQSRDGSTVCWEQS